MGKPITESQAKACLEAVKTQFAALITPTDTPVLYPPGHEGNYWVITWEGGVAPYDWPFYSIEGGTIRDWGIMLTIPAPTFPKTVFPEPQNGVTLALFRA